MESTNQRQKMTILLKIYLPFYFLTMLLQILTESHQKKFNSDFFSNFEKLNFN